MSGTSKAMEREAADLQAKLAAQAEAEKELQALGVNFPEVTNTKKTDVAI